ncbi:LtrC-like protein [Lactiplantibacillus plantarum]|uniref:LtrC-like protein n=1 Tax=Lactiplantibacillus plantarum TaxID=1590 RepID=A0A162GG66_LACPN|nr:LtrC-like protein [Lactiplantibacillus plantarum]
MPSKADVKAWKAQLVAQAEQQILKLTDSDQFKKYLNTLAKPWLNFIVIAPETLI